MRLRLRPLATVSALVSLALTGCGGPSARHPASGAPSTAAAGPTVAETPSTSQPGNASATAMWSAYHRDAARTGRDPTSPAAGRVSRRWTSPALDGQVYTEPLVVGDTVVVATEADTVYALDRRNGGLRWSKRLGQPVPGGDLPCGDIDPSGITGTPVIDPSAGTVWVVALVRPGRHNLVGLDLATGAVRSRRNVDPSGADPLNEQQRGALNMVGDRVYIPFGGLFGDCGQYHGYVVSLPKAAAGPLLSWQARSARGAAIWAPPGPVVNGAGQLYVTTGNGSSTTTFDDGNAVVRLSQDLRQQDDFAPTNWASLSASDADLGSVSPSLVAGGLIFQIGKSGVGYVLDSNHLGGVGGQLAEKRVCGGAYGGTAVHADVVFVPCRDGLVAVRVSRSSITPLWHGGEVAAGSPIVAGGMVWMMSVGGDLYEMDEQSGVVRFHQRVGSSQSHFPSLSAAAGQLFVVDGVHVTSFGGV